MLPTLSESGQIEMQMQQGGKMRHGDGKCGDDVEGRVEVEGGCIRGCRLEEVKAFGN